MRKIITILLLALILTGCGAFHETPSVAVSKSVVALDTVVKITVYSSNNADFLLEEAFVLIDKYEKMFSRTIEGSDIYKINNSNGSNIVVNPETTEIITLSLKYYEMSSGAFDITIGGISELWDFNSTTAFPDTSDIQNAIAHVGSDKILLSGNVVKLSDSKTKLDLGGIAKGYIADKLSDFFKQNNVAAIIDLGGNIVTVGQKSGDSPWIIGIEKPFAPYGEFLMTVNVNEMSLVTSGSYQRYFVFEDELYHHILNTKTGYPIKSGLTGVTLISEKSADGDALSTVLFCLGEEKGLALIETLPGIEAVFVRHDGSFVQSSGFSKFM